MGEWTGTVIAKIEYFGNRQGIGYPAFYVPFKVPEGIFKWHFEFLKTVFNRTICPVKR